MQTDVEAGYERLKAVLQAAANASPDLPDNVTRNQSLRSLFGEVQGSSKAYLNLVDDDADELAELIGDDGNSEVEFYQRAAIEWIVREPDRILLDQRFDAGVAAIASALRAVRSDPAWDDLQVRGLERANLSTNSVAGIKAGRIPVAFLLTAPDVLGNIL